MNMNQVIVNQYSRRDKQGLETIKENLNKQLQEFDVFFEEYLEMFDDKMSAAENQKTPEWKAYNDYLEQYSETKTNLKLANYYLGML
jgi:hypothetical protein